MQISGSGPTSRSAHQPNVGLTVDQANSQAGPTSRSINQPFVGQTHDQISGRGNMQSWLRGTNLTPVEKGEMARDFGDLQSFIKELVEQIVKFLEDILGSGQSNDNKPGPVDSPKPTSGVDATKASNVVEGAKTIDDFTLVGASKKDRADFKAMLQYLQRADANGNAVSPTAVELLAQLPEGQKVNINNQHMDYFDPSTGEIGWDPRSALIVNGSDEYQSPALGFIHEVDHAVNHVTPQPTGDNYHNTEEKRVITGSETQIAEDFGEPTRTDHLGDVKHVKSPSEHS